MIRTQGDRYVQYGRAKRSVEEVASGCRAPYRPTMVKEDGAEEKVYHLRSGGATVRLPGLSRRLTFMVVWGFGKQPVIMLTDLPRGSRKRAWRIVGVAEFRFYAIADGIKDVLYGRSRAPTAPESPLHHPILPSFAPVPKKVGRVHA